MLNLDEIEAIARSNLRVIPPGLVLAMVAEIRRLRDALMVELINPLDEQWECQNCGALAPLECDVDALQHRGKDCPLSPDCDLGTR